MQGNTAASTPRAPLTSQTPASRFYGESTASPGGRSSWEPCGQKTGIYLDSHAGLSESW
jgi:hypothetical protein